MLHFPAYLMLLLSLAGVITLSIVGTIGNQPAIFSGTLHDKASGLMLDHNQYAHLADALLSGKVSLDLEVSPTLASMDNPYDADERYRQLSNTEEFYYFDYAFFKGKYYCYFGVAPALLLYMPFQAITGCVLPTPLAVLIMSSLFAALIPILVTLLFQRFAPGAPLYASIVSSIAFFLTSNVILIVYFPSFYAVPAAASLLLSELGLIFWLMAGTLHAKKDYVFLWLGALCMGANLASRPQLFAGFLLAIPLFWDTFKNADCKQKTAILAGLLLPLIVIIVPLGYYNWLRFGSPFDLGANYNLTLYDIAHFHVDALMYPLLVFYYLFDPPIPIAEFPFLRAAFMPQFGMSAMVEPIIAGFFCLSPLAFILFTLPQKWKTLSSRSLKNTLILCGVATIAIIFFDSYKVGTLFRYFADFGWLLGIAIVITVGLHASKIASHAKQSRRFIVICIFCLIVSILLWFFGLLSPEITWHQTNISQTNPEFYNRLASLFRQ